ncbi:DUF1671-domain-containing protein [Hypoxylon sp. FL1284]|nr:DUF1671-domain-containing protein [Hypoxylon sp. FL1284]
MAERLINYCPFCGHPDSNPYALLLHIEEKHAEGKSPFVADGDGRTGAEDEEDQPFPCPVEGCGQAVALNAIEAHMEGHGTDGAPAADDEEVTSPEGSRSTTPNPARFLGVAALKKPPPPGSSTSGSGSSSSSPAPKIQSVAQAAAKKLGRSELGRYHNEDKMPDRLVALLKKENFRSSSGVIPVLQQLLQQNRQTEWAYLCVGTAQHIWKLEGEGSFCGYRNIQMLVSCVVQSGPPAAAGRFAGRVPDIFALQDMIEDAWDRGVNPKGRVETGGVRGTRKFIGTPEAAAIFVNLGIGCDTQGFRNEKDEHRRAAENRVYDAVERYFASAPGISPHDKVRTTQLPPLYFQHRGHSMTIVGIEKRAKRGRALLVFDPTYSDPSGIRRHIGRQHVHSNPNRKLDVYRRGSHYLGSYREFEILSYVLHT